MCTRHRSLAPAELVGTRIKLLWAMGSDDQDEWWEGTLAPVTLGPHVGVPGWFFCRYDKDADKYDRGADVVLDDDHDVFIMLRADEMMRATTQQVLDESDLASIKHNLGMGIVTSTFMDKLAAALNVEAINTFTQWFQYTAQHLCARPETRAIGLDAVGYCAEDVGGATGLKVRLREVAARSMAVLDRALGTQPKFLGDPIEIS